MKVEMFLGKVKKFGIGWCIPHRMAADNAKGGTDPPPNGIGLNLKVFYYTKSYLKGKWMRNSSRTGIILRQEFRSEK